MIHEGALVDIIDLQIYQHSVTNTHLRITLKYDVFSQHGKMCREFVSMKHRDTLKTFREYGKTNSADVLFLFIHFL